MPRDEGARAALRRLALGNEAARDPGRPRPESADRPMPNGDGSAPSDDRPSKTQSSEADADEYADADAVDDVVDRAMAVVSDLDAAARFADDGGVEALAATLAERRRDASTHRTDEGAAALRAFCAFERAAATGPPDRSGSTGKRDDVGGGDGRSDERRTQRRTSTSASDSPDI